MKRFIVVAIMTVCLPALAMQDGSHKKLQRRRVRRNWHARYEEERAVLAERAKLHTINVFLNHYRFEEDTDANQAAAMALLKRLPLEDIPALFIVSHDLLREAGAEFLKFRTLENLQCALARLEAFKAERVLLRQPRIQR